MGDEAEEPARAPGEGRAGASWRLANALLLVLAIVLAVLTVVAWRPAASGSDADPAATRLSEQYAAVTGAARREATAFLSLDYRDTGASTEAVLRGATGSFERQYTRDRAGLERSTARSRAVSTAKVLSVGLGEVSQDRAIAYVAADQQVRNRSTGAAGRRQYYRLALTLEREDGAWLTSGLKLVRGR